MANKSITVPVLARVEGEGSLELEISNDEITKLELRIFEPPRLFEKFLENRGYEEVLDFVARICGICPIAYQMTAVQALEKILRITPSQWVRQMRRLFYCGEWLSSHSTHIHLLALPDFFGFASAPEMAKVFPEELKRGLRLQAVGNEIIKLLGARPVHPVGACVGGFFRAPTISEANELLAKLKERLPDAEALLQWVANISLPNECNDFVFVSLQHDYDYPITEGNIVTSTKLKIGPEQFEEFFSEYQVPYSNALHCKLQGKPYLVGPLARLNLNYQFLPDILQKMIKSSCDFFPSNNMFHSIIARAIEIIYCILEAIRILESYKNPQSSRNTDYEIQSGVGYGATEAPRGLLWHRYELDEKGFVKKAKIIAPTGQNQACMEEDLAYSLKKFGLRKPDDELRNHSEMIIRNYDPCISCSTHFLDLRTKRL